MKMCYMYILALFIGCVMLFVVFLRFINIIKWKISDPWVISDVRHTVSHFHDTKHSSTRYKSSKLHWHNLEQEIIKVREWIVYIGLIAMIIPVKLFLNRVPSSSMDITRAMRGQAKRLSRNYLRRNGGNVFVYVLILCHSRDVFCTLSRIFVRSGFRLVVLAWLFIIWPFIRF